MTNGTIAMWMQRDVDSTPGNGMCLFSLANGSVFDYFRLHVNFTATPNNYLFAALRDEANATDYHFLERVENFSTETSTWYHVVFTQNDAGPRFYINGQRVAQDGS